jgi:CRP/FNR family transcriptional regulator, cyclic AMP receptor protein
MEQSMAGQRTLAHIALFRSVDSGALKRLEASCLWRDASAKEWLLEHEEEGSDVYFVVSGEVRVLIQALSGREIILADIKAGGYFGEMSAIDGQTRSASIRAITNATIASMSAKAFAAVLRGHPSVTEDLLRQMVTRIRSLLERINEFSSLDVRHRIYAELLRMSRPDAANAGAAILSPPPLQADIAARIGTRREMVSRELKALQKEGLLTRKRGAYVIASTRRLVQRLEEAREKG